MEGNPMVLNSPQIVNNKFPQLGKKTMAIAVSKQLNAEPESD